MVFTPRERAMIAQYEGTFYKLRSLILSDETAYFRRDDYLDGLESQLILMEQQLPAAYRDGMKRQI